MIPFKLKPLVLTLLALLLCAFAAVVVLHAQVTQFVNCIQVQAGTMATVGGRVCAGTSTPEAAITGWIGDLFLRRDGGAGSTLYVKQSGTNTNTGWVALNLLVTRQWLRAGWCNNATPAADWSFPATDPAVLACVTGTNTQKAVLDFADGANVLSVQRDVMLPTDFTGAIDAKVVWYTTAISGDVVWQIQTICVADAETGDPAFNTASTVTDTAKGTTNQYNEALITGITQTGCAAGETLYLKVTRDPTTGADTLAATARLTGIELSIRRAM